VKGKRKSAGNHQWGEESSGIPPRVIERPTTRHVGKERAVSGGGRGDYVKIEGNHLQAEKNCLKNVSVEHGRNGSKRGESNVPVRGEKLQLRRRGNDKPGEGYD